MFDKKQIDFIAGAMNVGKTAVPYLNPQKIIETLGQQDMNGTFNQAGRTVLKSIVDTVVKNR